MFTLPSGRQLDMQSIKDDIKLIHENVFAKELDRQILAWCPLNTEDQYEVLTSALKKIRSEPFFMTMKRSVDDESQRLVAILLKNSRLSEVFEVPDDLSLIAVRPDVTPEAMKELDDYTSHLPQKYYGYYELQ